MGSMRNGQPLQVQTKLFYLLTRAGLSVGGLEEEGRGENAYAGVSSNTEPRPVKAESDHGDARSDSSFTVYFRILTVLSEACIPNRL